MDSLHGSISKNEETLCKIDPIFDIIDFLVRCAKISFKNSCVNEPEIRTVEKIEVAYKLFKQSPTLFLIQFGKFLSANHLEYFEKLQIRNKNYQSCVADLKLYHCKEIKTKRVRNRRYKAMQKLQQETDYFSEKQMMFRNPLLYEQLIGQYLTEEEVKERDCLDNENFTFLNIILDTVDRNHMREMRHEQMQKEDEETFCESLHNGEQAVQNEHQYKETHWGDIPDNKPSFIPEIRKEVMINANERNLLREEFLQEMYSSFVEGRDINFDYETVDNNEEYDDLQQISQDAEDKYFDSEDNDMETLEDHMQFCKGLGRKTSIESNYSDDDPLEVYMKHITQKLQ